MKKILRHKIRTKVAIDSFLDNKIYLESGTYYIDPELRYFYKDDCVTVKYMEKIFKQNNSYLRTQSKLVLFIKQKLSPRKINLLNKKNKADFKGTVYFLASGKEEIKDIKIFDLHNDQVLSIYAIQTNYCKAITNYNYFSNYFRIPKILSYNPIKLTYIEELVSSKIKSEWREKEYSLIINEVFKTYDNYYKSFERDKVETESVNSFLYKMEQEPQMKKIVNLIKKELTSDLLNSQIPIIFQHGDLNLHNLMLDKKNNVYFIDWDTAAESFLFFDLLNLFIDYKDENNEMIFLEKYISGKFDYEIENIFSNLNYTFKTNSHKQYIYVYILEKLYRLLSNNADYMKEYLCKNYLNLFLQIKEQF